MDLLISAWRTCFTLIFVTQRIKILLCGVVAAVPFVDAKASGN